MTSKPKSKSTNSSGQLLALLTACVYALFTLLPDSHSLMVAWSWVFIWQVGLLCPVLWLLAFLVQQQQFPKLGNGLDWLMGFVVLGIIVSTVFAEFPNQARWYGWAALCFIAAIYALNSRLYSPDHRYSLLKFQGYLNIAFILVSLSFWIAKTLLPELSRLQQLKQYGVNLAFDFSVLELRNWAPLGHQNYVAGYLLLALPLLVGLSILETEKKWGLWVTGVALGLLDLYTTSSRGGWLGLFALCLVAFAILLIRSRLPKLWIGLSGFGILGILVLLILANNRLRSVIGAILSGQGGGELAYRIITGTVGWRMGLDNLFSGAGLGNVPLLYQKYLPAWAGYEAELAYQLHSTPAQIWAELGLWGAIALIATPLLSAYLFWHFVTKSNLEKTDRILLWSIFAAFFAYFFISLTDYQLDNVAISGTLVIYLACLASALRETEFPFLKYARGIALAGLGLVIAVIIWLVPIHRAWQLSSQAFTALNAENPKLNTFVKRLETAHNLAPWEAYYPYQLGWKLGDIALQTPNPSQQQELTTDAIRWLEEGVADSPYREFGHTNLGWLLLTRNPEAATQAFTRSAELVPAKRGVFYGLGVGLLAQGKTDLALESFTLEVLRDPSFLTSPVWNSPGLEPIYPQLLDRVVTQYTELLQIYSEPSPFNTYLHSSRGGIYWWQGNLEAARKDLEAYGTPLSQLLLNVSEEENISGQLLEQLPESPEKLILKAWSNPNQRQELLQQAWVAERNEAIPPQTLEDLLQTMEKSNSFEVWLKENAPTWQYRRQRAGFGVLSRHVDGVNPTDFLAVVENIPVTVWFSEMLPSPRYYPELDLALKTQRKTFLPKI